MTVMKLAPVHPGEVLALDFLEPMGITPNALAVAIGVPATRVHAIVKGKRAITADTALRLATFFGMTAQFWINLQTHFDLDVAHDLIADDLVRIRPLQRKGA